MSQGSSALHRPELFSDVSLDFHFAAWQPFGRGGHQQGSLRTCCAVRARRYLPRKYSCTCGSLRRMMTTRQAYDARRIAERKAAGLCVTCGRCAPEPGRALCAGCADKNRRNASKQRVRIAVAARKADVCRKCFEDRPRPESTVCDGCTREAAIKAAARRDANRAAGLCSLCGDKRAPGSLRCAKCKRRLRDEVQARRDAARRLSTPPPRPPQTPARPR